MPSCCSADKVKALLGKSVQELEQVAAEFKQPKFRGKQLHQGILQGAKSLNDISNVSPSPAMKLAEQPFTLHYFLFHHPHRFLRRRTRLHSG